MVDMATWAAGRLPVVVTYHAATLIKPGSALMHLLIRGYLGLQLLTLARARAVIAVSPYVREQLAPWQSKTTVVSNAVDTVGNDRDKAGTGLTFVSNLEPTHRWKGLDMIIEALAILKRNGQATSLTVVGDGADRPRYEQRVRELGLSNQVHFAGQLVGTNRDTVMRQAAAVVLYPTTANDAFPTVMLEAWAQGVPVIAAATGPLPSLVEDGVTGLLVEPRNPTALAKGLRHALDDPARLLAIGEVGRQLVAHEYTWPRQVTRTLAVFEALIERPMVASPDDINAPSKVL
jgi:rhamnosyl/mannosyltransferase